MNVKRAFAYNAITTMGAQGKSTGINVRQLGGAGTSIGGSSGLNKKVKGKKSIGKSGKGAINAVEKGEGSLLKGASKFGRVGKFFAGSGAAVGVGVAEGAAGIGGTAVKGGAMAAARLGSKAIPIAGEIIIVLDALYSIGKSMYKAGDTFGKGVTMTADDSERINELKTKYLSDEKISTSEIHEMQMLEDKQDHSGKLAALDAIAKKRKFTDQEQEQYKKLSEASRTTFKDVAWGFLGGLTSFFLLGIIDGQSLSKSMRTFFEGEELNLQEEKRFKDLEKKKKDGMALTQDEQDEMTLMKDKAVAGWRKFGQRFLDWVADINAWMAELVTKTTGTLTTGVRKLQGKDTVSNIDINKVIAPN